MTPRPIRLGELLYKVSFVGLVSESKKRSKSFRPLIYFFDSFLDHKEPSISIVDTLFLYRESREGWPRFLSVGKSPLRAEYVGNYIALGFEKGAKNPSLHNFSSPTVNAVHPHVFKARSISLWASFLLMSCLLSPFFFPRASPNSSLILRF